MPRSASHEHVDGGQRDWLGIDCSEDDALQGWSEDSSQARKTGHRRMAAQRGRRRGRRRRGIQGTPRNASSCLGGLEVIHKIRAAWLRRDGNYWIELQRPKAAVSSSYHGDDDDLCVDEAVPSQNARAV